MRDWVDMIAKELKGVATVLVILAFVDLVLIALAIRCLIYH